jgi:hypothetical protein
MLNNREWAILIWSVGIFLVLMARREIRSSVGQLLRTLLSPPLLIPLLVMIGYVLGEVWLGYKAGLWRSDLIKDTIVWFVISALAFFFGYDQASKFELGDALLCSPAVPSLPHLSLEPVHQRGWGSTYAALARGRINTDRLRDLLVLLGG